MNLSLIYFDFPFWRAEVSRIVLNIGKIKFNDIYEVIYRTFDAITVSNNLNVEAIYEIDHQARMEAEKMVKSIT